MIRRLLAAVGRCVDSLVARAPQVQFGVAGAVDEREDREVDELIASLDLPNGAPLDHHASGKAVYHGLVSAAADAAETGPEAVSTDPPAVPASGQPDPDDLADHVAEYVWEHRVHSMVRSAGSGPIDRILCNGCPGGFYQSLDDHADHISVGVRTLIADTARMAAATNKFRN